MPLDPEDSPGFLLWHVTLRWQREIAAALAPLGLTHVQFVLLAAAWWLNSRGQDPNQLSVARQAGTDVKMTSEVLRKLEAKGLIVRTVDAADTRARRIRVTERGGELAAAAVTAVEGVDAAFFRAVPDPGAAAGDAAGAGRRRGLIYRDDERGLAGRPDAHRRQGSPGRGWTTASASSPPGRSATTRPGGGWSTGRGAVPARASPSSAGPPGRPRTGCSPPG